MRSLICSLILVLGLTLPAVAQSPRPAAQSPRPSAAPAARPAVAQSPSPAATPLPRPQFRPAVLATGPQSLVNLIDSKALLAKGQKDGAVQFAVVIGKQGEATEAWVYHAMPGSKPLEDEVLNRLGRARFTVPLYEHQPVSVILYGTVVFDADEAPYVKILLNQDPNEIKAGSDFIAPQPVIGADSGFDGLHEPPEVPVAIECIVELKLHVDEKGSLVDFAVTGEDPPLLGFRQSAEEDFKEAKFIPAFRDGDVTDSTSFMSVCYKPVNVNPGGDEQ